MIETRELNIKVPETINDLTVKQYQEYVKIDNPTAEDVLEVFYDIPRTLIEYLPARKVTEYVNLITKFLNQEPVMEMTFNIGKTKFGFIPNLEEITYGENKDITEYFGNTQTMHRAMAVMYRPITEELNESYLIEDYSGSNTYADIMKEAPLGAMLGATVFFWNLINELQNATQSYFLKILKKSQTDLTPTQLDYLQKNGGVMENFTKLHKGIFEDMRKSLAFRYNNV